MSLIRSTLEGILDCAPLGSSDSAIAGTSLKFGAVHLTPFTNILEVFFALLLLVVLVEVIAEWNEFFLDPSLQIHLKSP